MNNNTKNNNGNNDESSELELELEVGCRESYTPPKKEKEKDTQRKEENNQIQQPMIPVENEEDKKESLDKLLEKIRTEESYDVSKNSYCNLEDDLGL